MVLGVKFHLNASAVDALTPTTSIEVWIVGYPLSPFSRESGHKKYQDKFGRSARQVLKLSSMAIIGFIVVINECGF